ncbi:MAG: 3-hydroxy-5-phosphonooxypentane-2,4-dione thiolase [Thermoguttaceae bacterium]|nr:3-hydroxy-5-phosphonooxypentane-2,4-dione thiolase [Thermoguttaceae bacterium]MBP3557970.1 3-hydroxy-5-phosphonooxypentane-2,4-dione thiolase [Thermoguttaceae bacterium]MBQ2850535.1 3-hydroxy-5-phosphonooxypentane-2,4-dione thiolase [Thermoguttaceae bacterium]MBQ7813452.1 3-hydroxy-5-phosphonooxypentane-2,4-dione thiolase [Thermoguttaceae bacterium]MBQ8363814.1 3-hydroxy-5-phosphonooxypentane-2,4-dione thiolase [Thermoguttaceae bacterium]
MADNEGNIDAKNFGVGIPQKQEGFFLKGNEHASWGIKSRLSQVFNEKSGRTVMLAFDHGFIMGPTSGLERIDLTINPLIQYSDCIMCCRGILRSVVPPTCNKPISYRFDAGTSILTSLNDQSLQDIEEAIRLNVSLLAVMVAIGDPEHEGLTVRNLTKTVDMGVRYGIPTLGVTAVGKNLTRDARYLGLATRICAENGANVVKTYYCEENFEQVTNACPIPIVIAGGKKLPERDALQLAYSAISQGAAGVDMGRNIFQSDCPIGMLKAVREIVHNNATVDQAFDCYETYKNQK